MSRSSENPQCPAQSSISSLGPDSYDSWGPESCVYDSWGEQENFNFSSQDQCDFSDFQAEGNIWEADQCEAPGGRYQENLAAAEARGLDNSGVFQHMVEAGRQQQYARSDFGLDPDQKFTDAQKYFERAPGGQAQDQCYNQRWDNMRDNFPSPPQRVPKSLISESSFDDSSAYYTARDSTQHSYATAPDSSSYYQHCPPPVRYQSPPDSPARFGVPVTTPRYSPSPRRRKAASAACPRRN